MKHFYELPKLDVIRALSTGVMVNLKIDTSAFILGRNDYGKIEAFGRDGREPISLVRRQACDLWEAPIKHLSQQNLPIIKEGMRIHMELFDDRLHTLVDHPNKPRNNLIISCITIDGKPVVGAFDWYEMMADSFEISPPPVLHFGPVVQTDILKLYDLGPGVSSKKFKDVVLGAFNNCSLGMPYIGERIEGVVVYPLDTELEPFKIVDPNFTREIKEKKGQDEYYQELNEIIFSRLEEAFSKVSVNQAYVSIVEGLADEIKKFEEIALMRNKYKEACFPRFSRLSFHLLPSSTKEKSENDWVYEDLFRTLLLLLRRKRTKAIPSIGLTKEKKEMVNRIIDHMT